MRSTELRHPAAYTPLDVVIALHRYGIEVAETAVACIDIQPFPQKAAESVPTDGCEANPSFTIKEDRKYIRSKSTSKQVGHFAPLFPCFFFPRTGRSTV